MKIVFFDGYCNLCNGFVDFLIKRKSNQEIKFASLQGSTAQKLLGPTNELNTVIYLRDEVQYKKSKAILMIFSDLGSFWKLSKIFFILPTKICDFLYDCLAKNRFALFGKRKVCRLPTSEESLRLLP